jgi:competence protein ComGF
MVVLSKMVKASTLIETIVAMVIIMICSGLGFSLFSNLGNDVNDELRIEAEIRMNSFATETKLKAVFTDTVLESANLRLQRSFQKYTGSRTIEVLLIEAYSLSGRKMCDYKELVIVN